MDTLILLIRIDFEISKLSCSFFFHGVHPVVFHKQLIRSDFYQHNNVIIRSINIEIEFYCYMFWSSSDHHQAVIMIKTMTVILESLNNCDCFNHNYCLMMVAWRPKHVAIKLNLNIDWSYNYIVVLTETSPYYKLFIMG
jgi:hypothetical protein